MKCQDYRRVFRMRSPTRSDAERLSRGSIVVSTASWRVRRIENFAHEHFIYVLRCWVRTITPTLRSLLAPLASSVLNVQNTTWRVEERVTCFVRLHIVQMNERAALRESIFSTSRFRCGQRSCNLIGITTTVECVVIVWRIVTERLWFRMLNE